MRRGTFFVDPVVQGRLAWKVAGYWLFCLLAVELFVACWLVWLYRPESSLELVRMVMSVCAIPFAASLILLPIALIDSIRFSHRFAGPMVRVRRLMNDLAAGREVEPLAIRDGDFWNDFAKDFNRLVARVEDLQNEVRDLRAQQEDPCGV
jgi:hypothetical protein